MLHVYTIWSPSCKFTDRRTVRVSRLFITIKVAVKSMRVIDMLGMHSGVLSTTFILTSPYLPQFADMKTVRTIAKVKAWNGLPSYSLIDLLTREFVARPTFGYNCCTTTFFLWKVLPWSMNLSLFSHWLLHGWKMDRSMTIWDGKLVFRGRES